jgi:predicted glycosyltransferase
MADQGIRVLIYCQDSLGLGHLRRNINIAQQLSRLAPGTDFLFVTDSPLAPFFALPPESDFVKLPTLVKVDAGVWRAHLLPLVAIDLIGSIRSRIIKEVALNFRPDVLLVDHMPHGARGELVESLQSLRRESPQTHLILGLRDILGAPDVITRQWRLEGAYEAIAGYYDSVFVYGSQNIYDLAHQYQFPESLQRMVRYCGYVCTPAYEDADVSLPQFSTARPFTVLLMGGGGSDAHYLMDTMLDAVRYLGERVPFNTFMLTGPFMPAQKRQELQNKAEGLPVVVRKMEDDSAKYLPHVDLVVSMAGYNTTCEILKFAKKAVVVPRPGPSAEQHMRSQILHDLGLIRVIPPFKLNPQTMAEAIVHRLYEPATMNAPIALDLDGALHAAQFALKRMSHIPG